jgi:hypothetical protein
MERRQPRRHDAADGRRNGRHVRRRRRKTRDVEISSLRSFQFCKIRRRRVHPQLELLERFTFHSGKWHLPFNYFHNGLS